MVHDTYHVRDVRRFLVRGIDEAVYQPWNQIEKVHESLVLCLLTERMDQMSACNWKTVVCAYFFGRSVTGTLSRRITTKRRRPSATRCLMVMTALMVRPKCLPLCTMGSVTALSTMSESMDQEIPERVRRQGLEHTWASSSEDTGRHWSGVCRQLEQGHWGLGFPDFRLP